MSETIGRIAMAEKLSVQQLKQAIQDKTVPAYIGIPMLQEKEAMEARMRQNAMAMQQPPQQQPPIADEVMQQADSIDALPTNLPPAAMAHGGIVAFADGGDVDNAYDEDYLQEAADAEDDARQANFLRKLALLDEMPKGKPSATGMSYKDVTSSKLKADSSKPTATGHKYEEMALKFAEKYNVDPKLALHVLNKETGGLKNPETARSKAGAMGVMQLMPATARGLGVKDPLDAEQNIEGGIRYLSQLSRQFDNPRLVAAAYNAGPGNVRKYGGVPPFAETRGYVQGLAEGGIASYAGDDPEYGSFVQGDDMYQEDTRSRGDMMQDWLAKQLRVKGAADRFQKNVERPGLASSLGSSIGNYFSERPNVGSGTLKGISATDEETLYKKGLENAMNNFPTSGNLTGYSTAAQALAARDGKKAAPATDTNTGKDKGNTNSEEQTSAATQTSEPKQTAYDRYIDQLMAREGKREKQAEQDKWLSLMTAGLGIAGGTSQYAAANIGQGALAGVNQYAGLRKQAAAEEAADVKNMLLAQKYKEQGELSREQQQYLQSKYGQELGLRKQELGLKTTEMTNRDRDRTIEAFRKFKDDIETNITKQYGGLYTDEAKQALRDAYGSQQFLALQAAANQALGLPSQQASGVSVPQGVIVRQR